VEDRTGPGPVQQAVMLALSVLGTAVMVWVQLPESERMMIALETRAWLHRRLNRAAHRAGHLGMGSELREHEPSAVVSYGLAYRLARLRDWL